MAGATHATLSFRGSFFQLPAFAATPWLERFAAIAVSFFAPPTGETQTRLVAGQIMSDSDAIEAAASPALIRKPASANTPARFRILLPALCTVTHLLPFAVGPPAHDVITHPTAVGTSVSGDSAAQGMSVPWAATQTSPCRVARLARPFDPRLIFAGSFFQSRFALRGESQLALNSLALRSRVLLPRATELVSPFDL